MCCSRLPTQALDSYAGEQRGPRAKFPAQVFPNLPQHPSEFFTLAPSRKANSGIPIVQQRVDLATNAFLLLRAPRLLELHVPLQSPLLGIHQIMV